ncbi:hypothetical protein ONZ45_g14546 [Pleurotus djamor]|nr:hypothetical protein ONZ45_g14546 [Pleurotus djamor]
MLSSFISYIPKGPKRKTKTLATGRQDAVTSRTFADAGEYGSYGRASSKPTPSWDYNTSFAHHRPPQVLDIRDGNQSSSRDGRRRPSEEEFLQEPPPASPRLEINLPQSNLADLMPPDLAKRKSFTLFMDAAVEDARDDGQRPWVAELGGNEGALRRGDSTETHEQQTEESIAIVSSDDHGVGLRQVKGDVRGNDEDDEGSVYSLEYVNFDAADAASNSPQQKSTEVDEETLLPYASTSRKPAPAPIQIPNLSLYGPKVQLLHTAGNQSRPQSRGNESIASTEPSSAVSGTSLARALFANTFVLSGNQTSRYRSGVSASFARQDSATLPRGEHPLMSSPFFGDRGDQFGSPIMIPGGTGVTLPPPSSYRPSTADSMHRRMPKRSGPDLRDRPKTAPGKRMSAKSLPNRATQDVDHVTTALELPTLPDEMTAERPSSSASPDRASRRISRISEATSSAPNTPDPVTQPQPKETEQTSEQSNLTDSTASSNKSEPEPSIETSPSNHPRVELTTAKSDSDIASPPPQSLVEASPEIMPQEEQEAHDHRPIEAQPAQNPQQLSTVAASPAPTPRSAGGFSMTSEPGSGKEIDNVLDYYQFDSQQSTFPTLRLPFSPISEESSSMLSPVSSQKSSGAVSGGSLGGESKMSKQQTEARLSLLPNAVRAAAEWSPRKPQSPPLMPIGGRELPRRPALLPIGERPRSTQVGASHPMSINSPLSSSSSKLGTATFSVSTASTLTSLASPDNGEPLLPPSRTIFNRARSGSDCLLRFSLP